MYTVTGSNLFGQWLEEDRIIPEFRLLKGNNISESNSNAKLCEINWSYNIYRNGSAFYLTGDWNGQQNQLVRRVELPEDCNTTDAESNLALVGNDYSLILVDKRANTLWFIDLEDNSIKKVNLNVEAPLENSSKRARRESQILQVVTTNISVLILTTDGRVYSGVMPSLLDTSHCMGKVVDVQCGYEHYMLLTDAGRVYTWGNGRRLQLGHGDLDNLDVPTEVEALAGIEITKIRAGGWHCFALSEFGDLYTWGWNDTGQLGVKHANSKGVMNKEGLKSYPLPTLVDVLDENDEEIHLDIKDVGCGSRHSVVMLEDNSLWTSGHNNYGQLGFSPDDHQKLHHLTKAFQCENDTEIQCGPWSTVLVNTSRAMWQ
ncbi:E3 ISG15--protein ligase HERC5-like isoform X2 [Ostrinia furnacalis]|uniref:E3 ISG15--protein ligase HERC5-like isoform X2 n=1 Tax=Ostrinia furnacalis TaxID=93504 RepID=UPI00103F5B90|nr:E3 ISG15--protein ligase HERC5-like isoform X2 [Ostrinia furnacalis]